jgi:pimeloyl-ACP methyl ester carboxylesterase
LLGCAPLIQGRDRYPGGRRGALIAATAIAATLSFATAAGAAERYVSVKGANAPGPAKYDRVFVSKFGPKSASRVLVLMPGTSGGAGDFTLSARFLVKKIPGLQVWAIDRRTQALEDTKVFRRGLTGAVGLQRVFDYYLGWLTDNSIQNHYEFLNQDEYPFARRWGMSVALRDARKVVQMARAGGRRRVILGGHSLGGSLTVAYASWDFNGRPGYRDLDGLVLIDGGLLGSFDPFTLPEARDAIEALESGQPFADLLGVGVADATGLFAEIGALFARVAPTASAQMLQDFPLLPPSLDPGYTVTNRALLGHGFDRDTSPDSLSLIQVNGGELAGGGNPCAQPCDWIDGGVTPINRVARTFAQEPANGVEWFFPRRMTIDGNGADQLRQNRVARFLGLRLRHSSAVDLPLYAVQTDLTSGRVLLGARNFIKRARTTFAESVLVDQDPRQSHLDPLLAAPASNGFLKTVVPFLKRAFR